MPLARVSAMAARQVYKVSPIEALAPVGVSVADRVPRWLRIAIGVGAVGVFAVSILIVLGRSGTIAVAASMTNIVSGFLITDRMLRMFRERRRQ